MGPVFLNRYDAADDLHRRNLAWLRDKIAAVAFCTETDELLSALTC